MCRGPERSDEPRSPQPEETVRITTANSPDVMQVAEQAGRLFAAEYLLAQAGDKKAQAVVNDLYREYANPKAHDTEFTPVEELLFEHGAQAVAPKAAGAFLKAESLGLPAIELISTTPDVRH